MASTTVTLNDLLPQIVAEAMFVAEERSIMRGLVKNYTLSPGQGKTVTVPIYPKQTAATITEGNEVSDTSISTDGVTLTVGQVGIRTLVTDMALNASASNVVADLGQLFGQAIARKIDTDLTGLFSGFTTNTVGSTSTAATAALIFQAVTKLKAQGVATDGISIVLHPEVAYDLKANMTNTFANPNGGDLQNEAMRMGFVGMLAGCPVYETANIANAGAAGDYVGGVFHRDALGLALMRDINIEVQRRASYLGQDVVASAMYGVGVLYEKYGCAASFDSSIA